MRKVFLNQNSLKLRPNDTSEEIEDDEYDGFPAGGQPESSSAAGKTTELATSDLPEKGKVPKE
jgi:hypothetical protein